VIHSKLPVIVAFNFRLFYIVHSEVLDNDVALRYILDLLLMHSEAL